MDNPWNLDFHRNLLHPLELMRLHPEKHKSEVLCALMLSEKSLEGYSARGKSKRSPSIWLQALTYLVHKKWEYEKTAIDQQGQT